MCIQSTKLLNISSVLGTLLCIRDMVINKLALLSRNNQFLVNNNDDSQHIVFFKPFICIISVFTVNSIK